MKDILPHDNKELKLAWLRDALITYKFVSIWYARTRLIKLLSSEAYNLYNKKVQRSPFT